MTKQEKSKEPLSPSKRRKDKIKKPNMIREVIKGIIAEGGSPSETTTEKVYTKAIKNVERYLGGGAELRGGGRAVMKKGGKV